MKLLLAVLIVFWLYSLSVLKRANLQFFRFLVGSVGLFLVMLILISSYLNDRFGELVSGAAGIIGQICGYYKTYYEYALILITRPEESISMYIDYECSGIIEIMAYVALLTFFPVYHTLEKIIYGVGGVLWIFSSNILRIFVICTLIYIFGNEIYFFAHTIFGRFIFYSCSIALYFYVFTRNQIKRQQVGDFSYGVSK